MTVTAQAGIAPPRFSVEILRNDAGISVIGLVPASQNLEDLNARFTRLAGSTDYTNLLQTADYPIPGSWTDALGFAVAALSELPRAKISVNAGRVEITALADSADENARLRRIYVAPPLRVCA